MSASDEPREEIAKAAADAGRAISAEVKHIQFAHDKQREQNPPHDFEKPCSNCGWTHELTDDPERCEVCQASPIASTDYCVAHTPPSPELRRVIADVLGEVARALSVGDAARMPNVQIRVHNGALLSSGDINQHGFSRLRGAELRNFAAAAIIQMLSAEGK